ncbi:uncharacterized protein LOC115242992 [Formica exsecta]|uniref:uncharacterized protein LOC115242992 n=1 Tax=Formica exsecta TaxID=72781 RepID=UPI001142BB3D|nr:uncharacterized protein LOC115242992 [Formica exsecta]
MIVESCHKQSLYGGVQLTMALWAASSEQFMADLSRTRVTPARPFQFAGVDYAGPVYLRTSPGRGHRATKTFLAIFVCLSTKAVHLDVASNYSAEAFIAAFRRFVSRRGLCSELFSDCGSNFVGADKDADCSQQAARRASSSQRKWPTVGCSGGLTPPAIPHFGGLWEAAVKATKHHMLRILGNTLTYEEMATLLFTD